jgi:hypothetical protein
MAWVLKKAVVERSKYLFEKLERLRKITKAAVADSLEIRTENLQSCINLSSETEFI